MKTPEICTTSKILPADHALGRYDPKSDRIFFSESVFFDYDEDTKGALDFWRTQLNIHLTTHYIAFGF
jgi:hypothetical protein